MGQNILEPWRDLAKSLCDALWDSIDYKHFQPRDFIVRYQKNPLKSKNSALVQQAIYILFYNESFPFKIRPSLGWDWKRFVQHLFLREYMFKYESLRLDSFLKAYETEHPRDCIDVFFRLALPSCNFDRITVTDEVLKHPESEKIVTYILPASTKIWNYNGPFILNYKTNYDKYSLQIFYSETNGIFECISTLFLPFPMRDCLISPHYSFIVFSHFDVWTCQTIFMIVQFKTMQFTTITVSSMARTDTFDFFDDTTLLCSRFSSDFFKIDLNQVPHKVTPFVLVDASPDQKKMMDNQFLNFGIDQYIFPNTQWRTHRFMTDRFMWYDGTKNKFHYILFETSEIVSIDTNVEKDECLILVRAPLKPNTNPLRYTPCSVDDYLNPPDYVQIPLFFQYQLYRCCRHAPGTLTYVNLNVPFCMESLDYRGKAFQKYLLYLVSVTELPSRSSRTHRVRRLCGNYHSHAHLLHRGAPYLHCLFQRQNETQPRIVP